MKNLLILIFIAFISFSFLHSYTIKETLQQIKSLEKEIKQNELLVEGKIENLKKTDSLFEKQNSFETNDEYIERCINQSQIINNLTEKYLSDLQSKMNNLRNRIFEVSEFALELETYNLNTNEYTLNIQLYKPYKERREFNIHISRDEAKILKQDWGKVIKKAFLGFTSDLDLELVKVEIINPVSNFKYTCEFPIFEIYNRSLEHEERYLNDNILLINNYNTFSRSLKTYNGRTRNVIFRNGNYTIFDIWKNDKLFKASYEWENYEQFSNNELFSFSKDGKYFAYCTFKYFSLSLNPRKLMIVDLGKGKIINKIVLKNWPPTIIGFTPDSRYLIFSENNKYKLYNLDKKYIIESDSNNFDINLIKKYSKKSENNIYFTKETENEHIKIFSSILNHVNSEYEETLYKPPKLKTDISFYEPSGNNYLDALEKGEINITVTNSGQGPAKGLIIKFEPERIEGLNYNNSYIEEIPSKESVTLSIPIEAYIDVKDNTHLLRINFDEINGFPPAPLEIQISTKSYEKPEMFIADVGIKDSNEDGKIESGEMIELTLRFANKGKGLASGTYAKFYPGNDVFITDTHPKTVKLGDLEFGEFVDISLEFFVNDRTIEEIPLFVDITEATGLATVNKLRLPIMKSDKAREIRRTVVTGIDKEYGDLEFGEDLSIDIEQNIPQTSKTNKNALAIIFGIEDYKNVSDVSFAHRDANFVKEYFEKTLGINNSNIYFKTNKNVTKAEFDKVFSKDGWLDKRVKQGKTEIYFYYAGHGAPEIKQNKAYLIPYDGDPNYASQTGYEMDKIYANLADMKAKSVTVFLDACFSGANRENEMLLADARPIMIEVEGPVALGITVFSATSGKEISSAWSEKKHGLFTYFLLKGFQGNADINADNQITIGELENYILQNVSETAGFLDREQTPTFIYEDKEKVLIEYE